MKIIKIIIWIVLIGLFGLVVYQDQSFFFSPHKFSLHFGPTVYETAQLPMVVFFVSFFLLGWLIAYVFGLVERFKVGRANKVLRNALSSQQDSVDVLKRDLEAIKANAPSPAAGQQSADATVEKIQSA